MGSPGFYQNGNVHRFTVRADWNSCLTVGHNRVFAFLHWWGVIDVFDMNGTHVTRFGEGTLKHVKEIAAGSYDQIFALEGRPASNYYMVTFRVFTFTEDGRWQNEFRVDSAENVSFSLACTPTGEHIVLARFERKTNKLRVAIYREDGVCNRRVTPLERPDGHIYGIAATNDGRVAISFDHSKENKRKVIVRAMKPL